MPDVPTLLRDMAMTIALNGLARGDHFAERTANGLHPKLDICALAYKLAENIPTRALPDVLFTDEVASLALIEASEPATDAIRAISAAITNYETPDTQGQPDYIEHVSNWTATRPIGCTEPPCDDEVIGCILRAADQYRTTRPHAA
ncbi:hypothetical protein [Streptomyces bottropensis]|uniref:hypothetical protein n=1 Tax=Streptomyces bottropensis TaxID=42235 RepID=UPI003679B052